MKHKKWLFPILSAAVASVAVVAIWINIGPEEPGEVIVREMDFPHMTSSIEQLSEFADVVVIGTVSEVASTDIDRGKEGTGTPMAYTLYKLDVSETLKGGMWPTASTSTVPTQGSSPICLQPN